ncbi:CcdB family protein [Pelagerythrobacter marensis]|uniref:Toxin CcdB n=1 Tax=Pelagerythrobacter marensis TaxID=543877 RepID=A0A0G3XA23_9SPHN|nr:CcdB family protein [Pelagerythrobacter marensis]AKM07208.1 plasmid maintenance protein CcdB [Pelagerythrobacter marensis]
MAQFDVYANRSGRGFLLDCQADLLSHLNVRFVVPLLLPGDGPVPARHLNPAFEIDGELHLMVTQYAGAVELRELGRRVTSLAKHNREIMNALDFLLTGV